MAKNDFLGTVTNMFTDAFSSKNIGTTLQGIGTLASAWGNYKMGKNLSNLENMKFNYEINKDKLALENRDKAQAELDDAVTNVFGKKKKDNSLTDAFGVQ